MLEITVCFIFSSALTVNLRFIDPLLQAGTNWDILLYYFISLFATDKYLKSLKLMVLKKQMGIFLLMAGVLALTKGIFLLMAGVLALTKARDAQILARSCHVLMGCLKEPSHSGHAGAGST